MKLILNSFVLIFFAACSGSGKIGQEITTSSGLKYTILKKGTGKPARAGQEVAIYETMGYISAKPFYSIDRPAAPIKIVLGKKQVIEGLEEAITGMRAGEIRSLLVPPSLSKRNEYPSFLSPDSTLLYRVELVEIR
jgi:FKBP-type peptidyl-prolyl cis-trans isomerase